MVEPPVIDALTICAPAASDEDEAALERFVMTEAQFQEFYTATARPLKLYLSRLTGSQTLADDLVQESYYRFLRAELPALDAAQRKNYLFRIGTNLSRDHFRQSKFQGLPLEDRAGARNIASEVEAASDVRSVLNEIPHRERELVWLAYVEGASHREIAEVTGLKEASVRPLLFRARQKLAALIRVKGGK